MEISKYEKYKKVEDLPIVTKVYLPKDNVVRKGVIQFIHGMCERKERYNKVLDFFTEAGYVCVISDTRGHGENVEFEKDLGYFGDECADLLIEDAHAVTVFIKNNFPDLPITLLGHSMGSLIARAYTKKYDEDIDALVLSGSPSMNPLRHLGIVVTNLWCIIKDEHDVDELLNKLMVGQYDKKFASEGIPNSWLCTDTKVVQGYNNDPKCGFTFTLNGHKTLCQLMYRVYSRRNWVMKNKGLRIAYFSGADDPCLVDKKTFDKSVDIMRKVGYTDVYFKVFRGMRHEIMNEPDYIKVCQEILKVLPIA